MRTVFQLSSLHAGDWLGRSPKPLSGAEDPVSDHTHPLFMLLSLIPASAPAKRSPAPTAAAAGPAARGRRVEGGAGQSSRWREMAGAQVWGLLGKNVYVPVQGEV